LSRRNTGNPASRTASILDNAADSEHECRGTLRDVPASQLIWCAHHEWSEPHCPRHLRGRVPLHALPRSWFPVPPAERQLPAPNFGTIREAAYITFASEGGPNLGPAHLRRIFYGTLAGWASGVAFPRSRWISLPVGQASACLPCRSKDHQNQKRPTGRGKTQTFCHSRTLCAENLSVLVKPREHPARSNEKTKTPFSERVKCQQELNLFSRAREKGDCASSIAQVRKIPE